MGGSIRRSAGLLVVAIGILAVIAAPVVLAADTTVEIADFAFPPTTTIEVGDTVTWNNTSGVAHTATADDASFDTGSIADGASGSVTFAAAGTFPYHCAIHASMVGSIVVQAAGGGTTVTPAPTDTAPAPDTSHADTTALVLAVLGVVMLVGTFLADRRFARATEHQNDRSDDA